MKKNSNDKKIQEYRRQKLLKWLIVILCLAVIVLEVLALLNKVNMLWGLGLLVIIYLLKKIL